jgi:hypothetical protein
MEFKMIKFAGLSNKGIGPFSKEKYVSCWHVSRGRKSGMDSEVDSL